MEPKKWKNIERKPLPDALSAAVFSRHCVSYIRIAM
jgi:hypothetical protein